MRSTLSFKLPEDASDFEAAYNGMNYKLALWEIDAYLRKQLKYNEELNDAQRDVLEKVREVLREETQELKLHE